MANPEELRRIVDRPGGVPGLRCLALLHGCAVTGRFDAVETLAALALERGETAQRLEEAALQVVPYGGFPRAIETFGLIAALRNGPAAGTAEEERARAELSTDGRATFDDVYARNAESVLGQLEALLPGFAGIVLEDAYGRILSRGVLSLGERELLAVAALALAALATPLASHIRGALRNGFAPSAVEDILHSCIPLAGERASPVLRQALDRLSRKVYRP